MDSFLIHLKNIEAVAEAPAAAAPASTKAPSRLPSEDDYNNLITRVTTGAEYTLLENLHLLSNEEVDLFLDTMFTESEVARALSLINSSAGAPATHAAKREPSPLSSPTDAPPDRPLSEGLASHRLADAGLIRRFEQAALDLARAVQDAGVNARRQTEEAYFNHLWAAREILAQGGGGELLYEASQDYVVAVQAAQRESQAGVEEAHLTYAREILDIWQQTDVVDLSPSLLWAVSQSMAAAAHFTAEHLGRWSL